MAELPRNAEKWRVPDPVGASGYGQKFATNQEKVETELCQLQNAQRLAIHVWEEQEENWLQVPPNTQKRLTRTKDGSETHAEDIPEHLKNKQMPIMSMSLLPSRNSGIGMKPFGQNKQLAYLIDLDQTQAHPAKVLTVCKDNLETGLDPFRKDLKRKRCQERMPQLKKLYDGSDDQEWIARVADDPSGAKNLSAQQLDILHENILEDADESSNLPVYHNEILVAATQQHVKAIVLPYKVSNDTATMAVERTSQRLMAAVSGLQHLDEGIDLPVVLYQISDRGSRSTAQNPQGSLIYLGQGKKELTQVALDAIKELSGKEPNAILTGMQKTRIKLSRLKWSVEEALGIDIFASLTEQSAAIKTLKTEAGIGVRSLK